MTFPRISSKPAVCVCVWITLTLFVPVLNCLDFSQTHWTGSCNKVCVCVGIFVCYINRVNPDTPQLHISRRLVSLHWHLTVNQVNRFVSPVGVDSLDFQMILCCEFFLTLVFSLGPNWGLFNLVQCAWLSSTEKTKNPAIFFCCICINTPHPFIILFRIDRL